MTATSEPSPPAPGSGGNRLRSPPPPATEPSRRFEPCPRAPAASGRRRARCGGAHPRDRLKDLSSSTTATRWTRTAPRRRRATPPALPRPQTAGRGSPSTPPRRCRGRRLGSGPHRARRKQGLFARDGRGSAALRRRGRGRACGLLVPRSPHLRGRGGGVAGRVRARRAATTSMATARRGGRRGRWGRAQRRARDDGCPRRWDRPRRPGESSAYRSGRAPRRGARKKDAADAADVLPPIDSPADVAADSERQGPTRERTHRRPAPAMGPRTAGRRRPQTAPSTVRRTTARARDAASWRYTTGSEAGSHLNHDGHDRSPAGRYADAATLPKWTYAAPGRSRTHR